VWEGKKGGGQASLEKKARVTNGKEEGAKDENWRDSTWGSGPAAYGKIENVKRG